MVIQLVRAHLNFHSFDGETVAVLVIRCGRASGIDRMR